MKTWLHRMVPWAVGAAAAAMLFATICPYRHHNSDLLAMLGVITTVAGFGLAYVAVLPILQEVRRRPDILLYGQIWNGGDDPPTDIAADLIADAPPGFNWREGRAAVGDLTIYLRAVINTTQSTRTTVDGILNIIVLQQCSVEVVQAREGIAATAYVSTFTDWSSEIGGDGISVPVRFAISERSWGPGNAYVVGVKITTPHAADWPILLAVDGDPDHHRRTRLWITTREPPP